MVREAEKDKMERIGRDGVSDVLKSSLEQAGVKT